MVSYMMSDHRLLYSCDDVIWFRLDHLNSFNFIGLLSKVLHTLNCQRFLFDPVNVLNGERLLWDELDVFHCKRFSRNVLYV